jgi:MerR family regulatory protein
VEATEPLDATRWTDTLKSTEQTSERWLKPSEVAGLFVEAGLFKVPLSTLRLWSRTGRIKSIRTAGGHRRYQETEARAFVAAMKVAA